MVSTSAVKLVAGVTLNHTLLPSPLFAAPVVQPDGSGGSLEPVVAPEVSSITENVLELITVAAEISSLGGVGPVTVSRQPGGFIPEHAAPEAVVAWKFGFEEPPPGGGLLAVTKKIPPNCRQLLSTVAVRLVGLLLEGGVRSCVSATVVLLRNPLPVSVSVSGCWAGAEAAVGEIVLTAGAFERIVKGSALVIEGL